MDGVTLTTPAITVTTANVVEVDGPPPLPKGLSVGGGECVCVYLCVRLCV